MQLGFALSGAIGAGKSTTVKSIIKIAEEQGLSCQVVGFASPLKELAVSILRRPINKATDRILLQRLGMGMRSEILGWFGVDLLNSYLIGGHPEYNTDYDCAPHGECISLRVAVNKYLVGKKWGYGNHWVDLFDQNLHTLKSDILLVEDMRFLNEYEYLCGRLGFKSIRVMCDEEVRQKRVTERDGVYNPSAENDVSEKEWRYIPYDKMLRTDDANGYQESLRRYVEETIGKL